MGIGQLAHVVLEQHHHRQARRLLAFFDHFENAVVGDGQSDNRFDRPAALVGRGDGQADGPSRHVRRSVRLDANRECVGRLPIDQPLGERLALRIPHRRDQNAPGRRRRREGHFREFARSRIDRDRGNLNFALRQRHRQRLGRRAADAQSHRLALAGLVFDGPEDRALVAYRAEWIRGSDACGLGYS